MVLLASMIFAFLNVYIETCISEISGIVGGESVTANQYPFIAWFSIKRPDGLYMCGGSILKLESPAVIITAAHCAYSAIIDTDTYVVLDGDIIDDPNGIKAAISSIEIHPNYNPVNSDYDIALLFIDEDLTQYSQLTSVGIFPLSSDTSECCNTGDDLTAIGYGLDVQGGDVTPTLEHVYLNYLGRNDCQNGNEGRYPSGMIANSMICAYDISNDAGPCHGDSGGPLIKKGSNLQIGIVSWGKECGTYPGVYTNIGIPSIYDWIQAKGGFQTATEGDQQIDFQMEVPFA